MQENSVNAEFGDCGRTDLPFFTLWQLSHSEERQAVEELPKLQDKT